jgi:hypothetical protein
MPTAQQYFIYLAIFVIGVILGRISMALQYAAMKKPLNKHKK